MTQLIALAFEAGKPMMWDGISDTGRALLKFGGNGDHGHRSFNTFGFDFMIDDEFKVGLFFPCIAAKRQ